MEALPTPGPLPSDSRPPSPPLLHGCLSIHPRFSPVILMPRVYLLPLPAHLHAEHPQDWPSRGSSVHKNFSLLLSTQADPGCLDSSACPPSPLLIVTIIHRRPLPRSMLGLLAHTHPLQFSTSRKMAISGLIMVMREQRWREAG